MGDFVVKSSGFQEAFIVATLYRDSRLQLCTIILYRLCTATPPCDSHTANLHRNCRCQSEAC